MKILIASAVLGVGLLSFAARETPAQSAAPSVPDYDVVIRNGRLLDGAGNPWVRADVAIKDGRFVKIGRIEGRGAREIGARGAPGQYQSAGDAGDSYIGNCRAAPLHA